MRKPALALLLLTSVLAAQERRIDPTFLHRRLPDLKEMPSEVTTASCRYKPVFGAGDPQASALKGIARYGEMNVDLGGACAPVTYPNEEQIYVVLDGSGVLAYGGEKVPLRKSDFVYLPPGVPHAVTGPCRVIVMGFRIPADLRVTPPAKVLIANIDDVKKETIAGHPPSTLYQLLMGGVQSRRDKLAAARVLTSLFIMSFAPGGTNFPHHHEQEEEIYLVLDGQGDTVAGGGVDGGENRLPSRTGDAYFFRLNSTVGFYNGTEPARILAVRSLFPGRR
jgi:mannose-6-phosphate isomerase-like protein (cupin superfamily)